MLSPQEGRPGRTRTRLITGVALQKAERLPVSSVWISALDFMQRGVGHSTRKPQCSLHLEMPSSVWVGLVNQLILLKEILHIHIGCLYWPVLCQACLWRPWECARKAILFGCLSYPIWPPFHSSAYETSAGICKHVYTRLCGYEYISTWISFFLSNKTSQQNNYLLILRTWHIFTTSTLISGLTSFWKWWN